MSYERKLRMKNKKKKEEIIWNNLYIISIGIYIVSFTTWQVRVFIFCWFTFVRIKISWHIVDFGINNINAIKFFDYLVNIWSFIWFVLPAFYLNKWNYIKSYFRNGIVILFILTYIKRNEFIICVWDRNFSQFIIKNILLNLNKIKLILFSKSNGDERLVNSQNNTPKPYISDFSVKLYDRFSSKNLGFI
jgi:hypothetical protein